MDKKALLKTLIEKLSEDASRLRASADVTRRAATHEESRPENDKDTRGLEASYLARGQAKRVVEVEDAINKLKFMTITTYNAEKEIGLSAVVEVEIDSSDSKSFFLVDQTVGALTLNQEGVLVQCVAVHAPLAQILLGKQEGDEFQFRSRNYEIVNVE